MAYDIIIGRGDDDIKKLGNKGLIFFGKQYVKMGQFSSLSNKIMLDVNTSHIILVSGKRGSGKSYGMSVMAEEMSQLPKEVSKNLSILIMDTMGIFWSMKFPNTKQEDELREWGMEPKGLGVKVYTPIGKFKEYKERGIPTDFSFSIRPNELSANDWINVFNLKITEPIGVLIERILANFEGNYDLDDIIKVIQKDKKSNQEIRNAAENRFVAAKSWGIFSKKASEIKDIVKGGQVSILDTSCYEDFNIKALVTGIISKKLFQERVSARKKEEMSRIQSGQHFLVKEKQEFPMVWIFIDECLPYDSTIITSKAHTKIGDIVSRFKKGEKFKVLGFDIKNNKYGYYDIKDVYKKEIRNLIELETETGKKIKCTENHRILTKNGFIPSLIAKDVGVPAFQHYNQKKECIRARLLGHIFGDGWISEKTQGVGFSGKGNVDDLNNIKEDLKKLGFSCSNISSRMTSSKIKNHKGVIFNVNGLSQSIHASRKVYRYFKELCSIKGQKVLIKSKIPEWLFNASNEEKCEFLGAYFGSDGNVISINNNIKCDFNAIRLSFNKIEELEENAFEFADEIKKLLNSLDIKVSRILKRKGNIRKDGKKTIRIVITIAKNVDNTIKFLEKVGYRYCERKEIEGNKWLNYLKHRVYLKENVKNLRQKSLELHKQGLGKIRIGRILGIKDYWVREWIYKNHKAGLPKGLPNFNDWISKRYKNKIIYEKILNKKEIEKDYVYDISVDKVHNFVADGMIVHNCHEMLPKEGKTPATDALVQILREGRQPGLSLVLATQQPGEIHKDVLTQSDIVISYRLTAKADIEALNAMMQTYLTSDILTYINNLPDIKGSGIILDDTSERIYAFKTRPKVSWHGGDAPTAVKVKKKILDLEL